MRSRSGRERGAAAVEFALVFPILALILFGILQYGLYFFDTLGMRQGVREAARQGVVENFTDSSCTAGGNGQKLTCITDQRIDALTGPTTWVNVKAPNGWTRGKPLVVCALTKSEGAFGLLPMPDDGWIRTETQLSIEKDAAKASWADTVQGYPTNSALPAGQNWSWCG